MAVLKEMNPNEWMTNPSPRFIYPMCRHCFYETSCGACQAVTLSGLAVYEMYRIEDWFYDKILPREKVEEKIKIDYDSIIDDVDSILEGEKGVKKKVDKEGDRKKVRKGQ